MAQFVCLRHTLLISFLVFYAFVINGCPAAHAQCSVLAEPPLQGIGVLAALPKGDTIVITTRWKAHKIDKVLSFARPAKGARAASITILRKDGHVQGIWANAGGAYFFTADSMSHFIQKNQTYRQQPLRHLWYLQPADSVADDESLLYILSVHLAQAWPLKTRQQGDDKVLRRVYAQGASLEECRQQADLFVAQECGPAKKTRKATDRYCDDGITYSGILEFTCKNE